MQQAVNSCGQKLSHKNLGWYTKKRLVHRRNLINSQVQRFSKRDRESERGRERESVPDLKQLPGTGLLSTRYYYPRGQWQPTAEGSDNTVPGCIGPFVHPRTHPLLPSVKLNPYVYDVAVPVPGAEAELDSLSSTFPLPLPLPIRLMMHMHTSHIVTVHTDRWRSCVIRLSYNRSVSLTTYNGNRCIYRACTPRVPTPVRSDSHSERERERKKESERERERERVPLDWVVSSL